MMGGNWGSALRGALGGVRGQVTFGGGPGDRDPWGRIPNAGMQPPYVGQDTIDRLTRGGMAGRGMPGQGMFDRAGETDGMTPEQMNEWLKIQRGGFMDNWGLPIASIVGAGVDTYLEDKNQREQRKLIEKQLEEEKRQYDDQTQWHRYGQYGR